MKKIIVIHHYGGIGGGTLSCFDVIEALKDVDYEIKLILPRNSIKVKQLAEEKKIKVLDSNLEMLTFSYYNGGSSAIKSIIKLLIKLKYLKKWTKLLKEENPDIVILNSIVQWPMIILLKFLKIKNVCFVRETMNGSPKFIINKIIKKILELSNGVSYLSKYDKNEWKLRYELKQVVIPDKISTDILKLKICKKKSREILNLDKNKFYILFLGGLNKLKGTETIIDAVSKIQNDNVELIILGDLSENLIKNTKIYDIRYLKKLNYLKKLLKKINKNKEKIRAIGLQSSTDNWYASCDLVVFPAEKAHQARPLYEAGAFKTPIIISNFENYREYISEGINGFTFIPNNSKDLFEKIQLLIDNKTRLKKMGEKNYEFTLMYHNPEVIDQKINDFIGNC